MSDRVSDGFLRYSKIFLIGFWYMFAVFLKYVGAFLLGFWDISDICAMDFWWISVIVWRISDGFLRYFCWLSEIRYLWWVSQIFLIYVCWNSKKMSDGFLAYSEDFLRYIFGICLMDFSDLSGKFHYISDWSLPCFWWISGICLMNSWDSLDGFLICLWWTSDSFDIYIYI